MKNIHILPTDKLSRLVKIYNDVNRETFTLKLDVEVNDSFKEYINVYVTSDEEIIGGKEWFLDLTDNSLFKNQTDKPMSKVLFPECKKIILTTDQDLIKDGVQAIPDEFLEWFVKNPNCEFVGISNDQYKILNSEWKNFYKIIIPKEPKQELRKVCKCKRAYENPLSEICSLCWNELYPNEKDEIKDEDLLEPKQDLEKEMFELEQELDIPSHLRWHNSKPKQETLEEAAEKLYPLLKITNNSSDIFVEEENLQLLGHRRSFIKGAKWQAERMYSEEEVHNILSNYKAFIGSGMKIPYIEWFEQFKKK